MASTLTARSVAGPAEQRRHALVSLLSEAWAEISGRLGERSWGTAAAAGFCSGRKGFAAATLTAEGAGAASPSRSVATSCRSSEPSSRRAADIFDANPAKAFVMETKQLRRFYRKINDAVGRIGPAIVHAHHD